MSQPDDCILTQTRDAQAYGRSLKSNPFETYRDPITGCWIVIVATSQEEAIVKTSNSSS